MRRIILIFMVITSIGMSSYAQKMTGLGTELSLFSIRPCVNVWFSKSTGIEIFAGQAVEISDFKLNDLEAGFKFLHTLIYNRTDRTYLGITGKWKWVNVYDPKYSTNLPVPGLLIGKEWYSKRIKLKGFAVELGYQFGQKEYDVIYPDITYHQTFNEFPLILNLRYTFISKWK